MGGRGRGQGGCERRIEVFVKIQKKIFFGGGVGGEVGGSVGGVGFGGGVRVDVNEIEVFVKIQKKKFFLGGGGVGGWGRWGGGVGVGLGGQSGCERRIEVFVKIQKKNFFWRGSGSRWGVRVDVNEELKFL